MKNVLVTGGAGFIGSHVAEAYLKRGDRVWVVDDLSSGKTSNLAPGIEFVKMDIADPALDELFRKVGGFDVVNHHAAQIDVRKSVASPTADARINIMGLLNVLECAHRHETSRVIFVSSGGVVYGEPDVRPTPETAPKAPLSPYGVTKLSAEYYLHYYNRIHGLQYAAVRYSNVYGPRQDPHGEAGVVAIFCERMIDGRSITIFGDGEQTRDYVYVGDVVAANLLLTDATLPPPDPVGAAGGIDARAFNVGTSVETTVNELAELVMDVAGRRVEVSYAAARPGELLHSSLATDRLRSLGWAPRTSLAEGLGNTYQHIAGHSKA